jgi:hypothetical protein
MKVLSGIRKNLPKTWVGWSMLCALPTFLFAQVAMTELRRDHLTEEFNKVHEELVPAVFANQTYKSESQLSYMFSFNAKGIVETKDLQNEQLINECSYEFTGRHLLGFIVSKPDTKDIYSKTANHCKPFN